MQVSSTTTTIPFVPVSYGTNAVPSSSSTSAADDTQTSNGTDQAQLNMSSATFSGLVQEAKAFPEIRSEVVADYKSMVLSGHYPPVEVISGLAGLLSGSSD